ncbi:putative signal peptide and transmembrane protein [Rhodopirellula islandica]|uniref:Signal peptide and transmembrane protein n=1 Tax=Rhodopirellula islandica TaxID=595434 RepID=A0A0J1BJZ2_RHOIS|nr:biopolymer transporter ExbD [Rhodopirellula islandica]KLU06876.1 putative signal peptide and transmembrane protein [Rhodopirellula islandica]
MKRPGIRSGSQQSIGMTSMIDVVFLLLVFFVWTSSFDAPEQDMPGGLAVAADSSAASSELSPQEVTSEASVEELILKIERSGESSVRYLLGTTRLSSPESLRSRLEAIAELGLSPPIIVDPEGEISMAVTVATVDLVRLSGFAQVHLAVSANSSGPGQATSLGDGAESSEFQSSPEPASP